MKAGQNIKVELCKLHRDNYAIFHPVLHLNLNGGKSEAGERSRHCSRDCALFEQEYRVPAGSI